MQIQMTNLLMLRDLSLRNSLLAKLPDHERAHIAGMIDEAFAEGGRVWGVSHLTTILGDEGAKRLLHATLGADPKEGVR